MKRDEIVNKLADQFAANLREDLTNHQMGEIRLRNRQEQYPNICHSHDFCDANMTMADAFERVIGREIDLQSDADITLWNDAWNVAKAKHLTAPVIKAGMVVKIAPEWQDEGDAEYIWTALTDANPTTGYFRVRVSGGEFPSSMALYSYMVTV